ncbi:hypothetical protein ABZX95_34470 [Streptomyces sp. NPDC004232]|uniref:hypothetical protein n=1 Tax=Streptomyces sp. NPDC004232 TaxID=3154454 RepID=UPI0033A23244
MPAASADGRAPRAGTVVVGAQPVAYDVLRAGNGGPAGVVRGARAAGGSAPMCAERCR